MLADLDLRQLRALVAVADTGSFGRAADQLGFTQSAISQQIAALERAVGDKVFDRPGGPRRVELTPIGVVVLGHARTMLAQLDLAADELKALRAGQVGRLVVGSFQSVSVKVLPSTIGRFRQERPNVTIRCVEDDENERLIAGVLDGELDLAFLADDLPDGLDGRLVLVEPFVLLSAAGDVRPFPQAGDLDGAELIGQMACACQMRIEEHLRDHGVTPEWVFRSNDNGAVQAMVREGMGRAILALLAVDQRDPGVVLSSLGPDFPPRRLYVAWRRGRTLPPAAERFVEIAADVCSRLPAFEPEAAGAAAS